MPDLEINYRSLAELRFQLRSFLRFSEEAARRAGLEPQQHQLLLALKGLPLDELPTITALAHRLQLRHHTVVGLIDRLEARGLLRRAHDASDHRRALIELTADGEAVLHSLSAFHQEELRSLAPQLISILESVIGPGSATSPLLDGRDGPNTAAGGHR